MEGDEVFSYISSNSMGGFKGICFLEDQTWYEGKYFEDALTATGDERFNLKMIVENQAMDTHPPLYYIFLNCICSIFSGRFSKWFGIGLNLFFLILVFIGLFLLMQHFVKNRILSLIISTIFCCSLLVINMVFFIRMYVLLMAIFLYQTWYHFKFYDNVTACETYPIKKYWKEYGILILFTILGALTHYYFLVFQCILSMLYMFGLWLKHKYKDIFRYIGIMAVSGIVYICIYPAAINHLFLKYRGREAVYKFFKGNIFSDFLSMLDVFDKKLFKGYLFEILFILIIITVIQLIRKRIIWKDIVKGFIFLLSLMVYFYGISKVSPYVTIRYVSPIASLIYLLIVLWMKYLIDNMKLEEKMRKAGYVLLCLIMFSVTFCFFPEPMKEEYFSERKEVIDQIAKETNYCVYITGDEYNWKMWEDYVNYPMFQGLYFIDGQKQAPIYDDKLFQQEKVLIYIDTALDLNQIYQYLQTYLPYKQYNLKYQTSYTYIILAE